MPDVPALHIKESEESYHEYNCFQRPPAQDGGLRPVCRPDRCLQPAGYPYAVGRADQSGTVCRVHGGHHAGPRMGCRQPAGLPAAGRCGVAVTWTASLSAK